MLLFHGREGISAYFWSEAARLPEDLSEWGTSRAWTPCSRATRADERALSPESSSDLQRSGASSSSRSWKVITRRRPDPAVIAVIGRSDDEIDLRFFSSDSGQAVTPAVPLTTYDLRRLWTTVGAAGSDE
jgi:hypothetical protein